MGASEVGGSDDSEALLLKAVEEIKGFSQFLGWGCQGGFLAFRVV